MKILLREAVMQKVGVGYQGAAKNEEEEEEAVRKLK